MHSTRVFFDPLQLIINWINKITVVLLNFSNISSFLYPGIRKIRVTKSDFIALFIKLFNTIKFLKISKPKLSNIKISFLGYKSRKLLQCLPFLSLWSVLIITNGYFAPDFEIILWKLIYRFTKLEGKTPKKLLFTSSFVDSAKKPYNCFIWNTTFHFSWERFMTFMIYL